MEWFELQHPSGCFGPALYRLRLVDAGGQPIPIPTLLGGPDPYGVVDIGETNSFEVRRGQIIGGVERCFGHSAGNLFRYLCQFTRLQEVFPGCRLQYSYKPAKSKEEAEAWESAAIKEYFIRRGQLPILNRELPKPYDDVVWNEVWEQVFGAATGGVAIKPDDV